MKILCRDRTRLIDILSSPADVSRAMNTNQLIYGGFVLIRAAMVALELAVAVLVLSIGLATAARLRPLRWFDRARRRSAAR
jgi:hypothetical protein